MKTIENVASPVENEARNRDLRWGYIKDNLKERSPLIIGESVVILSGPFKSYIGKVLEITDRGIVRIGMDNITSQDFSPNDVCSPVDIIGILAEANTKYPITSDEKEEEKSRMAYISKFSDNHYGQGRVN